MEFDLVVRNGLVIDGSGSPGTRGDVAVVDDRIVAIGDVDGAGRDEIDADGLVVAPGFVDGHTHMDAQVFWDELGTSSCWHGVTTVVMGNCGFTLAPAHADSRRWSSATWSGPRTFPARRWRRARLDLVDVRRIPGRRRSTPQGDQLRRRGWAFGPADVGHG